MLRTVKAIAIRLEAMTSSKNIYIYTILYTSTLQQVTTCDLSQQKPPEFQSGRPVFRAGIYHQKGPRDGPLALRQVSLSSPRCPQAFRRVARRLHAAIWCEAVRSGRRGGNAAVVGAACRCSLSKTMWFMLFYMVFWKVLRASKDEIIITLSCGQ